MNTCAPGALRDPQECGKCVGPSGTDLALSRLVGLFSVSLSFKYEVNCIFEDVAHHGCGEISTGFPIKKYEILCI